MRGDKKIRGFLLAAACFLFAAAAQAAVRIEHWTAPSGARVYFVQSSALPILDIQVDFAAGSAYDPPDKSGLARLTRSMLDGGAGELSEEDIAGRLVDTGARLSGSTDLDRSSVSLRTLASRPEREAAIGLLRTVLQAPKFPADVLDREKARTIAAIKEADTQPESIGAKRFSAALYPGHPYGLNPTAESIARIGRDDLLDFHRGFYTPARSSVTIVGDISRAEAEDVAQRLTAGLAQGGTERSLPEVAVPKATRVNVAHPATQSHIYVGMPGMRRGDPDFFPLLVGNYILGGGGFVSRLLKEVREKRGYAYSVYSAFQPYRLPGPFQIGLQTKREQSEAALEVVEKTVADFLRSGPTEAELRDAKRNLIDGFALRLDTNRKILDHVAMIGFYGLPLDYLDRYPKEVEKVTAAQIRDAFARRIHPDNLVTVVVAGKT
jgi:zinc protease